MNWKLIFQLSFFGLAMAIATAFWISSSAEPYFWLAIFIVCSYLIAKQAGGKYFLHGFMVSIFNSVWITAVHVIFFDSYMANHPDLVEMNARMPMPDSPRLMMVLFGPVIGILFGVVLGLFSFAASKIVRK